MSGETLEPRTLDYSTPRPVKPVSRSVIVILAGSIVAVTGCIFFFAAHNLSRGAGLTAERQLHEVLWSAFGLVLVLCGGALSSIGAFCWCRDAGE